MTILCVLVLCTVNVTTFGSKMVLFHARNANIYKICELHSAIFSSFYNNLQENFAISLILRCSFQLWWWISFFLSGSKFRKKLESSIEFWNSIMIFLQCTQKKLWQMQIFSDKRNKIFDSCIYMKFNLIRQSAKSVRHEKRTYKPLQKILSADMTLT
jgi:hypothetical protein